METRIEVFTKEHFPDSIGNEIASEVVHIGITSVDEIRMVQVYLVEGDLSGEDMRRICDELLIDGLTQDYICINGSPEQPDDLHAGKIRRMIYTQEKSGLAPNGKVIMSIRLR